MLQRRPSSSEVESPDRGRCGGTRREIALGGFPIGADRSRCIQGANLDIVKRFELPMAAITKCLNVARHS
jgi:hypothetical protein